jgi:hypothetical protein
MRLIIVVRHFNDGRPARDFGVGELADAEPAAVRDVAVGCLALRIRKIGPSKRRISCLTAEDSLF